MQMWKEYLKEREGAEVYETDAGFAIYSFPDNSTCYLKDIYVKPGERLKNWGRAMADQVELIAKERGCDTMIGSVDLQAKYANRSMQAVLSFGMTPYNTQGSLLLFTKAIREGKWDQP